MIEGKPTVLIKGGHLQNDAMARELLNESELVTVVHRQGFTSLNEIEECVLEPGGTFSINGRTPRVDERHTIIMERLDEISRQLADIRGEARA
jgi:uncharacterized membrane protein YcaP (DUF421 family)